MRSSKPYRFEEARRLVDSIVGDLAILAGESVGPSGATWQDVAGTLSVNLEVLACRLKAARAGKFVPHFGAITFPSLEEAVIGAKGK